MNGIKVELKEQKDIAPGIVIVENSIDNCDQIINKTFEDQYVSRWRDSKIIKNGSESVDENQRKTRVFDVIFGDDQENIWNDLGRTVYFYADSYAKNFNFSFVGIESFQILHYTAGDGFYVPHCDDGPMNDRICSAILYLNDVEEGGETHFNLFNLSIKPKSGRLVLFPSNYPYVHEAKTPKSQDKFCVVTWFQKYKV